MSAFLLFVLVTQPKTGFFRRLKLLSSAELSPLLSLSSPFLILCSFSLLIYFFSFPNLKSVLPPLRCGGTGGI